MSPINRDRLIIFKLFKFKYLKLKLINGGTSLTSLVGTGSKIHIDGLEEVITRELKKKNK